MAWWAVGSTAVSVVGGYLNSRNARNQSNQSGSSGFDPTIQAGEQQAVQTAETVANQPFQAFDPNQAVAGLSENQVLEAQGAKGSAQYLPQFEATAGQEFTPDTIAKYSNPYTQQVLAAQNALATRNYQTEQAALASKQGMTSAFGGDRSAIANNQLTEGFNLQSDLRNKTGLSDAYNAGVSAFNQDRTFASGQENQVENELSRTGGVQQATAQNRANFNYNQYVTARDWTKNQNAYLTSTLGQVPKGSYYSGNQTSQTVPGSGGWGGALAGAAQIGMMGGGAFGGNTGTNYGMGATGPYGVFGSAAGARDNGDIYNGSISAAYGSNGQAPTLQAPPDSATIQPIESNFTYMGDGG